MWWITCSILKVWDCHELSINHWKSSNFILDSFKASNKISWKVAYCLWDLIGDTFIARMSKQVTSIFWWRIDLSIGHVIIPKVNTQ